MKKRSDIPILFGHFVELCHLTNKNLNGLIGFVKGWNNEKERYVVQLKNKSLKLVKPVNLLSKQFLLSTNKKFLQFLTSPNVSNLKQGKALLSKFNLKAPKEFILVNLWYERLKIYGPIYAKGGKKVLTYMQNAYLLMFLYHVFLTLKIYCRSIYYYTNAY